MGQSVVFSSEVEEAISQVLASDDPLDSEYFNVVDYINGLFPNEQSLSNIDSVVSKLHLKLRKIDNEVRDITYKQTYADKEGLAALKESQVAIRELCTRIKDIKSKAEMSEQMVQEITRDIKSLDYAKRHLTSSINALNHMHMLIGGVGSLRSMSENRQYKEAASLLQALLNIMQEFDRYKDIEKIREISDEFNRIQTSLKHQVRQEFDDCFSSKQVSGTIELLQDACLVMETLGDDVRDDLIDWFVRLQLSDYRIVFAEGLEVSSLDKIKRRYSWCKRTVALFEEDCEKIFPASWHVSKHLFSMFCTWCRKDLVNLLQAKKETLDVKLLLSVVGETLTFEKHLMTRFGRNETVDGEEKRICEFSGMISSCLEPYMVIYVEAQDKILSEMVEEAVDEAWKIQKSFPSEKTSLMQLGTARVLPSSSDLFLFYKDCLVQCATMSTKESLFQLYKVFIKYLSLYMDKVLLGTAPRKSLFANVAATMTTQTMTTSETYYICVILNTAHYCLDILKQLETKVQEKIDEEYKAQIDMSKSIESVHEVISECIQMLVKSLENGCEEVYSKIQRVAWSQISSVGDVCDYVETFCALLSNNIPVIREGIDPENMKYFNNLCLKLASLFIARYLTSIYQCRPGTAVAVEQMLLDCHQIKQTLVKIHSMESDDEINCPSSYVKYVNKNLGKLELCLKVVMTPHSPPEMMVQSFLRLIPEKDFPTFQKLVDMKSLSKADEQSLYDAFIVATGTSKQLIKDNLQKKKENTSSMAQVPTDTTARRRLEDFINKFQ